MADIAFYENALDPRFARALLQETKQQLEDRSVVWSTNVSWQPEIVRASHPVLMRSYASGAAKMILEQLGQNGVLDPGKDWKVQNYVWTRLSYIPWHNDGNHSEAVTVYLNEDWDSDWGGLFLWRESMKGPIQAREPRFNTALRNADKLWHATTPVMLDAPEPRITLQLFRQD